MTRIGAGLWGQFQFTPLREGRLNGALTSATVSTISIHAPPRGATSPLRTCSAQKNCISIHAPPRGATRCSRRKARACADFNSRPSARGDTCPWASTARRTYFNSRPSARGDRQGTDKSCSAHYFNSRPSARGDAGYTYRRLYDIISIHAPPRGATLFHLAIYKPPSYFNSRPSARGDCRIIFSTVS